MKVDGVSIRRTYLEVPTMNSHKWDKIQSIDADVFMADMEDSVPPKLKEQARDKVLALVRDPSYFGDKEFICRPNNLSTPWGREDVEALAEAGAPFLMYPKARSAAELLEVKRIFDRNRRTTEIAVLIETPEAVLKAEELASCPMVSCLMFGPGDFSMETGISLLNGRTAFTEGMLYPRSKTQLAARAHGLEAVEGTFVADLKDLEAVREATHESKLMGYTGTICFYPPWIPVIHQVRTPSREDVGWSRRVVAAYEEGLEQGEAAITVDGKWLTVHQYRLAQDELTKAQVLGLL